MELIGTVAAYLASIFMQVWTLIIENPIPFLIILTIMVTLTAIVAKIDAANRTINEITKEEE